GDDLDHLGTGRTEIRPGPALVELHHLAAAVAGPHVGELVERVQVLVDVALPRVTEIHPAAVDDGTVLAVPLRRAAPAHPGGREEARRLRLVDRRRNGQ